MYQQQNPFSLKGNTRFFLFQVNNSLVLVESHVNYITPKHLGFIFNHHKDTYEPDHRQRCLQTETNSHDTEQPVNFQILFPSHLKTSHVKVKTELTAQVHSKLKKSLLGLHICPTTFFLSPFYSKNILKYTCQCFLYALG